MPLHVLHNFQNIQFFKKPSVFRTMSGDDQFLGIAIINLRIFSFETPTIVWIVNKPSFKYDILLGLDTIKKFRLRQDEFLTISQAPFSSSVVPFSPSVSESLINWNEAVPTDQFEAKVSHLSTEQQNQISSLIDKYSTVFAKNQYDIGTVSEFEAHIKLLENKYIAKKPYRCTYADQAEIERQVSELLHHSIIEESTSPFASPVTMAYKRVGDGSKKEKVRMCIDFRELNKLIIPESQPFPLIDDIVIRTRNCNWFSALDINSAFWSIPVRAKDRYKTAFITQHGHYQWRNLPFGLKTSPAIFQRILSGIVRRRNLSSFCCHYIDDIIIFSKSFAEHVQHIEQVLQAIIKEGFKLKFVKCNFATQSVKYLGHIISKNSVRPLSDNLVAIRNFPVPSTRKHIRQWLGKINFYHKFIPNAANLLNVFHRLLRKNVPFVWDSECQRTFERLKDYLTSAPVLAIFDPNLPITIYTDASGEGIGAILKQQQPDGPEKPVAFFSKKLNDAQKRKKAIYIESYAIYEAVKYWRFWLLGRKFLVVTDHKPLENLNLKSRPDEELGDIAQFLLQFDFNVVYRPGAANAEADCLSRNPVLEADGEHPVPPEEAFQIGFLTVPEVLRSQSRLPPCPSAIRVNGMLARKVGSKLKILLDEQSGLQLIERVHLHYGHIGSHHIYQTLKNYYHFRDMYRKICEFTSSCKVCLCNKTRRRNSIGLLGHLGPASRPFEIMSLDTVGGFGGRRSTKRYLHILVDHFTRYVFILTSANQTSSEFIRLLRLALRAHPIETLLTDQYGGLASNEFENFIKSQNIQHLFTAVDHPESNGLNERVNQSLVNRIRCRINESANSMSWASIAHKCVTEYNATIHSVTGFSPTYLLNGQRDMMSPLDSPLIDTYSSDLHLAFENSLRSHNRNKKRLDRNRKDVTFSQGDLVFIENGNKLNRNKLDPVRAGPFVIHRKLSNTLYEVNTSYGNKISTRLYHISKIFPCT